VTDREYLLADVNDGRRLTLLALADAAEEALQRYRPAGLRWLAKFDRWPVFVARREDFSEADDLGPADEGEISSGWEWWRAKPAAVFSCSLPVVLIEAVRKQAKTPKGQTCVFDSAGAAILAAADAAGRLIEAGLLDPD
jgi:hypothetical protein